MNSNFLSLINKLKISARLFGLLFIALFFLSLQGASAASRSVVMSGKTLSKAKVQVSCSLAANVASKSRRVEIGRAFNSNRYRVIGRTSRRVRRLVVRSTLRSYGRYYFICRVTLRNGRIVWSNRISATVKPRPKPTAIPTKVPELRLCPSNYAATVINLVNRARGNNGLSSLQNNSQLQSSAQGHTNWMAQTQRLTHGSIEEMLERIRRAGFTGATVGENIARGQTSPAEVMNDWLNSPPHRANILDSRYRHIGIGCVIDRRGEYWWTQNFGS